MNTQTTHTLLMIEPLAFDYNSQTAENNYFQHKHKNEADQIQDLAQKEFSAMVSILKAVGIRVIVVKDNPESHTPDAVFCNNWISFHEGKKAVLFPMFALNRRSERRIDIIDILNAEGYHFSEIINYSDAEKKDTFLESTGSMVLDRTNRIAYAALSDRTDKGLFEVFCKDFDFEPISFHSFQSIDNQRLPIFHTNVMMTVAEKYAVICLESIDNPLEREQVQKRLEASGKEIISISEAQVRHFAGNMLQVKNVDQIPFLILSQSAYDSLDNTQTARLKSFNELIVPAVPTIEKYGGGSVRCMMCEIF